MDRGRRWFLSGSVAVGAAAMFGCTPEDRRSAADGPDLGSADGGVSPDSGVSDAGLLDAGASDPFAGGTLLGPVDFAGEGDAPLDTAFGEGLDGRLYTDLSRLDEGRLIVPNERFYIRTRAPDRLDRSAPWELRAHGLLSAERRIPIGELTRRARPMGPVLLECSGNGDYGRFGLLGAAEWDGVPLSEVLGELPISPSATRVLVSGFDDHSRPSARSTPGASWIFTLDEMRAYGGFLATRMNGVDLPLDHGAPVRLVMPRWYGCTCIKWVNDLELVDDRAPSTEHMREFASRTHQSRAHALAKDFEPATMDQAAMPVRVERWRVAGRTLYRVVGVMWGGYALTRALEIQLGAGAAWAPVDVRPPQSTNDTWTLWRHTFAPTARGRYRIRLRVNDPGVRTRRLDSGFYDREVEIAEV